MIDLNTLISIFVFLIGACIGSFLNVVALRGLSGESIVFPPSKCPKCNNKLNWYTNIPIISYCFLRGKCQFCKEHISIQYPVVEALNAVLYLACFLTFGYSLKTLFLFPLISLFIAIAITDFKESVVLDIHTYIIMGLGLIYSLIPGAEINFVTSLLGILAGFLIFEALARAGYIFAGTRAFGEGDTLIAMGIGAFFGWKPLMAVIFISVIIQALMTIPVLLNKSLKNKNYKESFAYCALILCVVLVYLFKKFNLYENFTLILVLLLMVCAVLLWALFIILGDIRNKKETDDFLYLPFGPALVISGLIMAFYQPQMTNFFYSLINIQ